MDRRLAFATLSILPALATATGTQVSVQRAKDEPRDCVVRVTVTEDLAKPVQVFVFASFPAPVQLADVRLATFKALPAVHPFPATSIEWADFAVDGDFVLASKRGAPVRRTPKWASPYTRKKWYFADYHPISGGDLVQSSMARFEGPGERSSFDISFGVAKTPDVP